MPRQIIIAIDGHSACGKSTLAKDVARIIGYRHIDSGAMYRATTWYFLENQINIEESGAVEDAIKRLNLSMQLEAGGSTQLYLDQLPLRNELRSSKVNSFVSEVAALPVVRRYLVKIQQTLGEQKGVVMDGRDIGSVVFPNAALKIFLTATFEKRVQRRLVEIQQSGTEITATEVGENLRHRDLIDSTRTESPLVMTKDAVLIDNTNLTRMEQGIMVVALAEARIETLPV